MNNGTESLADRVAAMAAARRRAPAAGMLVAAHHRADADDREQDQAPVPAAGPNPLDELGEAVERFEAAWTDLRAKIRRAVDGRDGR